MNSKPTIFKVWGLVLGLSVLSLGMIGCESEFPGERAVDLTKLNRPYAVKPVVINSTRYLGVVNTNAEGDLGSGSLQFYSINNPASPSREEGFNVQLPNNISDFHFHDFGDGTGRLFILDRNEHRILAFDFSGTRFTPHLRASGRVWEQKIFRNAQSLVAWTREPAGIPYLAIATERAGSIQFFNITEMRLFDLSDLEDLVGTGTETGLVLYVGESRDIIGARLEVIRRTSVDGFEIANRVSGISAGEQLGRGINRILSLPSSGDNPLFVIASYTDDILFGFNFDVFDNSSNVLWDPRAAIRGGSGVQGTKEEGFRGLARDGSGNVYASSRSTNRLYRVPVSEFSRSRTDPATRSANTLTLAQNSTSFELPIDFAGTGSDVWGVNPAEKRFPRLGDLQVNGQGDGDTATRAWVLGLESNDRGAPSSRLHQVDLVGNSIQDTIVFEVGEKPQYLSYIQDLGLLAVTAYGSNRLYIYDVSGGAFVVRAVVSNP